MKNIETWDIRKPAVESKNGIVVTQHYEASQIAAQVLAEGGNAVDAAVAASFAIGVLEPAQSGIGSIGHMVVAPVTGEKPYAINFSARLPMKLDPKDYPLTGNAGSSMFSWPQVLEDRNMEGPYSIGVPGQVAGTWLAHSKFGRLPWARLVTPAASLCEEGVPIDWNWTFKIATSQRGLARDPNTAAVYLPGNNVPVVDWRGGTAVRLWPKRLAKTLRRIAEAGGDDFYRGDLAAAIAADAKAVGSCLTLEDLHEYRATIEQVEGARYRDATIFTVPGLTAGPSLLHALERFAQRMPNPKDARDDAKLFPAIAAALLDTYAERLATSGPVDTKKNTCTTHISVIDRDGNAAALTQTLLQNFGSRVTFPETGILLNDAVTWFDPVPGKPNSIGPGKTPLSNMCPLVARVGKNLTIALGSSGGRRIFPSIMHYLIFLIDRGMTVDEAVHYPRIDVSGDPWVTADRKLSPEAIAALQQSHDVHVEQNCFYPSLFGVPTVVARDERTGVNTGGAFVVSPWASAAVG
ncbi:gamma-glutamyltransferase family protein [Pendulispora albinea]|uniref:Gamma-glutamyltransferase n=1 Tax=Pendulispora albinea TaxID=2741071 RepID=A0ABZ2LWD3_9BACT